VPVSQSDLEELESTSVDEVSGTSIQQQLHRSKQASAEVGLLLTSTPFVANDSEPALSEKTSQAQVFKLH